MAANEWARKGLFDLLRRMGLDPMEFQSVANKVRQGSPTMEAILQKAFQDADAVIALSHPMTRRRCEKVSARRASPETRGSARNPGRTYC